MHCSVNFILVMSLIFLLVDPGNVQEKGSNEIVFKAMGRAINKTVTIVELIKVFIALSEIILVLKF